MEKGLIQIYTGDGKGKTTAAIGLLIRAFGCGLNTGLIQFLKGVDSSELKVLKSLGIPFWQFGRGEFIKEEPSAKDRELAKKGLEFVESVWVECDLLVLDEISYLITCQLVAEEDVLSLLKKKPKHLELVLTGRDMPEEIMKEADLITEMKKIRHPYDKGILARKGIEY